MDNNTLDNHLAKPDLRQILADIKKAGYYNSFKHQKGYIIVKKTSLVKVQVVLDKHGNLLVTTIPLGIGDILFSIFFFIICTTLGGIIFLGFLGYILVGLVAYVVSLPKSRELKTEIEGIIGIS